MSRDKIKARIGHNRRRTDLNLGVKRNFSENYFRHFTTAKVHKIAESWYGIDCHGKTKQTIIELILDAQEE